MSARFVHDEEITAWREDRWMLVDGLIGTCRTAEAREGLWIRC